MERGAKPAKAKVEARPAVTGNPRKVDASTGLQLKQRLAEALEQHAAISEILQVISASPSDVQPVLDAVAERAARLCEAPLARVLLVDRDVLRLMAEYSLDGAPQAGTVPLPLRRSSISGRAVLDRATIHHDDVVPLLDSEYPDALNARRLGIRAALAVPLMREGNAYGAIFLWRREPGLFSPEQVALVQTFAQQAAIAVDNVRLFNETKEGLEQQTSISEILQVISTSPADVKPVLNAVAERALKLCDANNATIFLVEGDKLRSAARIGSAPGSVAEGQFIPLIRGSVTGRAIIDRSVIHIEDLAKAAEEEFPLARELQRRSGHRATLSVPLMREDGVIGAITLWRLEARRFTAKQIALVKTFADQAAIAIENVRLFNETKEALERQTATSEILRVISQSPTDVQPVFETIASAAQRLCGATSANLFTFDGELLHPAARARSISGPNDADDLLGLQTNFPRPPGRDLAAPRAVLTCSVVSIPDVLEDTEYKFKDVAVAGGFRSVLAVPLIRDGAPIGAIVVGRPEPGQFPDKQLALLQTFAAQAVIAIENVRLFDEVQAHARELSVSLQQQTATADVLKVISRSAFDLQKVLDTLTESVCKLCDAETANIWRPDGDGFKVAAMFGHTPEHGAALKRVVNKPGRASCVGRALLEGRTVHIRDAKADPEYKARDVLAVRGNRAMIGVPLLREGAPIGVLVLTRSVARPFTEKQIALATTFADQAVIAIENVRLFTELEARTAELTKSVGELRALGEVGQAVSSTLDLETVLSTIVSRATQLAGMDGGSIWEYDETREQFHLHATDRLPDELVEALRATPIRKGEGALGRLAMTGEPVEIRDIVDEGSYQSQVREILIRCGYRSVLAVPLLRENNLLGALAVIRNSPGAFAPEVIELLRTFATQSALAIQNARLFREIEEKSRELETASRHKSEFLANMSHELRTPLNAIIGFSEVLSERMFGEINDKQAEYLADILESGQHLLSLINDILDLSKIEAGRMELEPTDFDLLTAIENTLILVRERAHRRGIALEHTVDERLGMICADERKVKQVLLNLLSNALKFTPEGGQINVRAEVRNGAAEISVTDTGVGIAPEDQEVVFEEFRQVGTASKKVEGTGLGLAISRKFIELHGGTIWVNSQIGAGSTFTFTLPLRIEPRHQTG
jgi:GAF domain-containing protein